MSTIFADKFKNTSGGNPVQINQLRGIDTAGSITVQGEGTNTTNLQQGLAKAWQIAGTDASVTDSLNTSANVDNGTGDHTFNIVNNMSSANYAINATASQAEANQPIISCNPTDDTNSSSVFRLQVAYTSTGPAYVHIDKITYCSIHGDLA